MRSFILPRAGAIENLSLVDRPRPEPGPGQVLVRVRACSLNYRDLLVATGRYGGAVPPDLVPLSDGAGEVAEVGAGVTRFAPGDRVCGTFFAGWEAGEIMPHHHAAALGGSVDGMLAEYRLFAEAGLVGVPAHLSLAEASTLPCAALTAWNALFGQRAVQPGDTVLVLGTGGVSVFALQFARLAGARVIATSSSDDKLARMKRMGAEHGVNYRSTPDWERAVWQLTGKRGVDHVVEVGGGGTLARSLGATRFGGSVHLIGVLAGGEINPMPILQRSVTLRGVYVGSRALFESMNRAIGASGLTPVIDQEFGFEQAPDAYRALEAAGHMGKIVIRVD